METTFTEHGLNAKTYLVNLYYDILVNILILNCENRKNSEKEPTSQENALSLSRI